MTTDNESIVSFNDKILVTGANGFIGNRLVKALLEYGFKRIRCFVRPSGDLSRLQKVINSFPDAKTEILKGNLTNPSDCKHAVKDVKVIYHLAAGISKSFAVSYLNSVVGTKNLLEATLTDKSLKRFVNISSFAVYSNKKIRRGGLLDETCPVEKSPESRGEAYCYAKLKQDELLMEYGEKYNIPWVILRPGAVFGPGKNAITGRVGIDTFGIYIHLGGRNRIPFSYVDNCADAIARSGFVKGVDGEIFNIVDDNLPRSSNFLKMYKKNVKRIKTISIHYRIAYVLCALWENYAKKSKGQLPPAFNRSRCRAEWKGNKYSNTKLKEMLQWKPKVPMDEALKNYFEFLRTAGGSK